MSASSKKAYSERLLEALQLAATAFQGTFRKQTDTPYLTHLLQVATWVGENGGSEDQWIAALLHDYLEDIDGASADYLEERFGANVRFLVQSLSDNQGRPKPPWKERKLAYLKKLEGASEEVKLIACADKLHNATTIVRDLETIGEALWDRFSAPKEGSLWYYRAVTEALGIQWDHVLLGRLQTTVHRMHDLAGVSFNQK